MGRRIRCLLAGRLVEVTSRAIQGRLLLRPDSATNQAILGTLGRAQRYTELEMVAFVFLSNHYHLLVVPASERQLAAFMQFLNTNLSKQIGRIHGWPGPLFQRRYQAIPVSDEPEAQVERYRYLLEHGAKEDLVARPEDWPGVHCVRELVSGQMQTWGVWHERSRIWRTKQAGKKLAPAQRVTRETVRFSQLPVWQSKSLVEYSSTTRELVAESQERIEARRAEIGSKPHGARRVLAQRPRERPQHSNRSPAPIAHAATVETWLAMKLAYLRFARSYREAAARLRAGYAADFPPGCFPPRGPYVARDGPRFAGA